MPVATSEPVWNRIARLREEKRWSQAELGRQVGITRSAINKIELGQRPHVSAAVVAGIALALGVTFEELWYGAQGAPQRPLAARIRELANDIEAATLAASSSPSAASTGPRKGAGRPGAARSRPSRS